MTSSTTSDYEILITAERRNDSPVKASVKDATAHLKEWVSQQAGGSVVFAVKAVFDDSVGWHLEVKAWNPDAYQGRPFPTKIISYVPSLISWKESQWMRGQPEARLEAMKQSLREWKGKRKSLEFVTQAFDAMFRVLMSAEMPCVLVESLGHSKAVEKFHDNVHYNQSLKRIEFDCPNDFDAPLSLGFLPKSLHHTYMKLPPRQQHRFDQELLTRLNANRNAELCTKLLKSGHKPESWKELMFLKLGACSPRAIQELLQAVACHEGLEVLDLRAERRVHTWNREKKCAEVMNSEGKREPLCARPLEAAMATCKVLKTLDLSGHLLSLNSVPRLISSFAHENSSLKTLLLRDTGLDGPAMAALASALKDNACGLEELDVSHNELSFQDMLGIQDLCASLRTNARLQSLKLEHCGFQLAHLQVLAEALPEMRGLLHLSLNGNWDSQVPSCVDGEEFAAYLAEGPGILVDALEHNCNLLRLEVGALGTRRVRSCATPSYSVYRLDEAKLTKLRELLQRNNEAANKPWKSRKQTVELPKMDKTFESSWLVSHAIAA